MVTLVIAYAIAAVCFREEIGTHTMGSLHYVTQTNSETTVENEFSGR